MSIRDGIKKRGRPVTTGKGTALTVRLHEAELAALDAHIAREPEPRPSRPEAIRRVLSERLSGKA